MGCLDFQDKNSNQEQVCHDFKFTLDEVLKIVVERCGTEPRAGHCWEIKNERNEKHGHKGCVWDNCWQQHVVRDPLSKSPTATDRCRNAFTHPCLRVSVAQVQTTEMKSELQMIEIIHNKSIRTEVLSKRTSEAKWDAKALSELQVRC